MRSRGRGISYKPLVREAHFYSRFCTGLSVHQLSLLTWFKLE